jgi:hypothetical protein
VIENLKYEFLYRRLPEGVINLDERGLIAAVVGGFSARLEDLRSYSKKLNLFFSVYGLPDPENNVVTVTLTSPQGVVYKHSLDITEDTPESTSTAGLRNWAGLQLGLSDDQMGLVQYDKDLLRFVDTSTLEFLAATVGAVLHQSSLLTTTELQRAANQKLVETYFPRLRIKGTTASFDVLGRVLGFDDVRVTPLWSRLSARMPEDAGNPANDADYAPLAEFYPQQQISVQYDPLNVTDGPFYAWAGTCSNGTSAMNFYTGVINGFNPWIQVIIVGSAATLADTTITNGTAVHVPPGAYALANGAPNLKAYVEPAGSSFRFEALVEGDCLNGLIVNAGTVGFNGTDRLISISDRLSSIKYRSSYFDLGLTVDFDRAIQIFGTQPSSTNKNIASGSYTPDGVSGTALSPYRPWTGGTLAVAQVESDFYTQTVVSAGTSVITPRVQASGTVQELIIDNLFSAAAQAVESMEEVRPATRFTRRSSAGLLIDDGMRLACYVNTGTLFTTTGATHYDGSHALTPFGGYTAQIDLHEPSHGTVCRLTSASDPYNGTVWRYRYDHAYDTSLVASGTYDYGNGSYAVDFLSGAPAAGVYATVEWTVTDTETIRPEPTYAQKVGSEFACQVRPEDEDGGLADESVDEYPWLADVVGGGDQVEVDIYIPEGAEVDIVELKTAFQDQSGVDVDVYGLQSQNGRLRLKTQYRPYDGDYKPGIRAIAYSGTFKNLSTLSADDISFVRPPADPAYVATGTYAAKTDYDTLFQAGYAVYHAGLVQGVLVADAVKFFGQHHRTGLVGWLPLNEHPEDDLTVHDAARTVAGDLSMLSIDPSARKWDAERGWHLDLTSSGTVSLTSARNVGTDFTISFWIKPSAGASGRRVLSYDPVFFDLDAAGTSLAVSVYDDAGVLAVNHTFTLTLGAFRFITVIRTATGYTYALSDLASPLGGSVTYTGAYQAPDVRTPSPLVLADAAFHDLRIWNISKTIPEMELVRYHAPTPTQTLYPLGFIETANRGDRWGMRVLSNGWITPDVMSPWYRLPRTGMVRRYTYDGGYNGASRFKKVGISEGHSLPSQIKLGYMLPTVLSDGTAVYSGYSPVTPDYSSYLLCTDDSLVYPIRMRCLLGIPALEILTTPVVGGTPVTLNFLCADDALVYPLTISNLGGPFVFLIGAPVVLPSISTFDMLCGDNGLTYPVSIKNDGYGPYINIGFGV